MDKHRAIPQGYMTVGQLAKKMNTTVRTLQYYDKEGLLSPSAESEGGRRLYADKDVILLHQIQSMKYLGFSLDDIKNRLVYLETPKQVSDALTAQAEAVREKIISLTEVLGAIETLKNETMQMDAVDFRRYADIVVMLQMGNKDYWVVKNFDSKMWDHIRDNYDEKSGAEAFATLKRVCKEAAELQKSGISPESEQGSTIAKDFWDFVTEFTGGDMSMLPEIMKFPENKDGWDADFRQMWENAEAFIVKAMEYYFTNLGVNPFEGVQNDDPDE